MEDVHLVESMYLALTPLRVDHHFCCTNIGRTSERGLPMEVFAHFLSFQPTCVFSFSPQEVKTSCIGLLCCYSFFLFFLLFFFFGGGGGVSKIICIFLFLRGLFGWLVGWFFSEGCLGTVLNLPVPPSIRYVVLI